MKTVWNIIKNMSAVLGVIAVVLGVAWSGLKLYERLFTSEELRMESERFHQKVSVERVDRVRLLDSIEKESERQWRLSQERKLKEMDSLIRLGVYLSNKAAKSTDTLNRNIEHTLEHVDQ